MTHPASACPCGQATLPADARFCHVCGRSVGVSRCAACNTETSPGARFCHRCGTPVDAAAAALVPQPRTVGATAAAAPAAAPGTSTPWLIAGTIIVVLLGTIIWRVSSGSSAPEAPVMANAGNAGPPGASGGGGAAPFAGGSGGGVPAGRAPDISNMTPRERFFRLYDRIMRAAAQGDSATVFNFTPMAIGAYSQLDTVDVDSRFDLAMLYAGIGQFTPAKALADTILAQAPNHLFAYVIRGSVAQFEKNGAAEQKARADFAKHYDAELKRGRPEYEARRAILDQFRQAPATK